jgi:transcriptional regulator with XRE-family HTH domain
LAYEFRLFVWNFLIQYEYYAKRRDGASGIYEYRRMPREKPPKSVFGLRMREARQRLGLAQDRLGVQMGFDEGCASARISRYETGTHEPPLGTARKMAAILKVPTAYLYCPEDNLAAAILDLYALQDDELQSIRRSVARLLKKREG